MKKIVSISFLLILVFSSFGYKLVLVILKKEATSRLEHRIEAGNYDPSELIEVKIPLNLSYYVSWQDYHLDEGGEVMIEGSVFQYLKRRVLNDTLFLTCIFHTEKMRLEEAETAYEGRLYDFQSGKDKSSSNSFPAVKLMLSEYLHDAFDESSASSFKMIQTYNSYKACNYNQYQPSIPVPPPNC